MLIAVIGSFAVTAHFVDPPVTDQSLLIFMKSDIYLPPSELTRSKIGVGLSKLHVDERASYKIVFCFSSIGMVGFLDYVGTLSLQSPTQLASDNSTSKTPNKSK
jgi:hypothetical protein